MLIEESVSFYCFDIEISLLLELSSVAYNGNMWIVLLLSKDNKDKSKEV